MTKSVLVIAALLCAMLPPGAGAQGKYPERAVRVVIPFVPGGSTDFIARVMQPGLSEALGQPIVLDNRPGAAGNIAVEMAANAVPDGHTVLFGNVGAIAINPDRKSTRLNSSHIPLSRMPSSA